MEVSVLIYEISFETLCILLLQPRLPLSPIKSRAGAKASFKEPAEMKLALEATLFGDFDNGQGRGEQQTLPTL